MAGNRGGRDHVRRADEGAWARAASSYRSFLDYEEDGFEDVATALDAVRDQVR